MNVLITGFEPFDGEPVNAAWEVVSALNADPIPGARILVRQLPTVFGASLDVLHQAIAETNPDAVICVGQAGGRSAISLERIGVNLDDARIPDNAGQQPKERRIVEDGPAAYWSTLPVRDLCDKLLAAGIPAEVSMSAGTYVCNHVLYGLLHRLSTPPYDAKGILGGFIHIPFLPSQAVRHRNAPCLSEQVVLQALRMVVAELLSVKSPA